MNILLNHKIMEKIELEPKMYLLNAYFAGWNWFNRRRERLVFSDTSFMKLLNDEYGFGIEAKVVLQEKWYQGFDACKVNAALYN